MKTNTWGKALNVIAPTVGGIVGGAAGGTGDQIIAGAMLGSAGLGLARHAVLDAKAKKANRNLSKQFNK